jgi:hypothetical protein
VIANFAGLGILASATLLDVQDYDDPGTGTLIVIGGALGGGAMGWMISDRMNLTRGQGHAVSLGTGLGLLNAALLLVPTDNSETSEEVLTTLLVGGTAGAAAGIALGKSLDLTEGQSLFATNVALLGLGSSLIVSTMMDDDEDGDAEAGAMTALVIGLDGGAAGGLLLAPKIKWSRGRARFVGAATLVGTFLGGMIGGLLATDQVMNPETGTTDSETNPDIAAAGLLVGMWGGFAGGIALSTGWAPDKRFRTDLPPPATSPTPTPAPAPAPTITAAPMIGDGRLGVVATGSF